MAKIVIGESDPLLFGLQGVFEPLRQQKVLALAARLLRIGPRGRRRLLKHRLAQNQRLQNGLCVSGRLAGGAQAPRLGGHVLRGNHGAADPRQRHGRGRRFLAAAAAGRNSEQEYENERGQ
ncbi:MAG: hypothetical protein PHW08_14095 [Kiritimatiellae bacterium]|nr:hypothetical protein [Kiritimatiellia bacterium]